MPVVPGIRIDDWEHVLHFGGASSQHPASAKVPWQPPAMGRLADRPAMPSSSEEEEPVEDATVATVPAEPAPPAEPPDSEGLDVRLKKASKRFRRPPPPTSASRPVAPGVRSGADRSRAAFEGRPEPGFADVGRFDPHIRWSNRPTSVNLRESSGASRRQAHAVTDDLP